MQKTEYGITQGRSEAKTQRDLKIEVRDRDRENRYGTD
jgi:hypothetical protein